MQTETKRGRGRPKGAGSFLAISQRELQDTLEEGRLVLVSRIWYEKIAKRNAKQAPKAIEQAADPISPAITQAPVEMTLTV
jgi:hypothetical protein